MITHKGRTILGDIPEDWGAVTLRDVLFEHSSGDWGSERGEVECSVLRSTNFTADGRINFDDVEARFLTANSAEKLSLKATDLLLERSGGGPTQPVGRIAFVETDLPGFVFSNFVQRLRIDPRRMDPCFVGWVLYELNRSGVVERLQHQTTQMRNLEYRDYLEISIPEPPKEEQEAIAKAMRESDQALAKSREELLAVQRMKTALMQLLFTKGVPGIHKGFRNIKRGMMPASWQMYTVSQIAVVGSGVTLNQDRSPRLNGYRYLTVINVQRDHIDLTEERHLELWPNEVPSRLLEKNDILVVEGHANSSEIGRAAMVGEEAEGMTFQNHLFRVRVNKDEVIPSFLLYSLNCERVRRHWSAICNTSSGLNTINRRQLRRLEIPKPSRPEQEEIVELIEASKAAVQSCEARTNTLTALKKSLLQNLLTGKVRISVEAQL